MPVDFFIRHQYIPVFDTVAAKINLNRKEEQYIPKKPIAREPVVVLRGAFPAS
jgi:hypothetical protein